MFINQVARNLDPLETCSHGMIKHKTRDGGRWWECKECDQELSDLKTTLKEIGELKFDWDWSQNIEPVVDKINELIDGYNKLNHKNNKVNDY